MCGIGNLINLFLGSSFWVQLLMSTFLNSWINKLAPSELKSVRFNIPENPVPFTTHSCYDFFGYLKYEILFDILKNELRIEYVRQVAKTDLAEWLRDCRQVRLGAKGSVVASVNEFYNEFGQVINVIGDDIKYTCNAALMFYNNLAPYICNQIKASGYFPTETFSDNSSQVYDLSQSRTGGGLHYQYQ
jgi:hypothetical protein